MKISTLLENINKIAGTAYLVGGSVRDILLGYQPHDIDLVVPGSAVDLTGRLAEVTSIKLVILEEEYDIVRVVATAGHVDITGLGNTSLGMDLKRRDFTINAMALPLAAYLKDKDQASSIIDPLNGLADLRQGIIRACIAASFEDDPVRVLRALRLQARYGFKIAPETMQLMRNLKNPLSGMPGERIMLELRHILEMPGSAGIISFLEQELNLLSQIFPEIVPMQQMEQNHYHAGNVWQHCLQAFFELEDLLKESLVPGKAGQAVQECLGQYFASDSKRLPVIKLACLFHDLGKLKTRGQREDGRITFYDHHRAGGPMIETIARRLKMSRQEIKLLKKLVEWHMQPLFLSKENPPSNKAVYRFFRNLGEDTPACLLISLADKTSSLKATGRFEMAIDYKKHILDLLNRYVKEKKQALDLKPLLTGDEICSLLDLKPSPLIGKLKEQLWEAQVEGKVTTRCEAVEYLRINYYK